MNPDTKEFTEVGSEAWQELEALRSKEGLDEWPRFGVGEEFELNGVRFYIRKITKKDVILRPVDGRRMNPTGRRRRR